MLCSPALFTRLQLLQTYTLVQRPKDTLLSTVADIMIKASNEERGTVAGLAAISKDLDDVVADG